MKKLLLLAGAVGCLALASKAPARADAYVDSPSFGRIVFGMTGGAVVLPQDAWQGAYPDGSGPTILPNPQDSAFGGGVIQVGVGNFEYQGDLFGTPGSNLGYNYAGAVAYAGGATSVVKNPNGLFGPDPTNPATPQDHLFTMKLGYKSSYGWESQIGVFGGESGAKPALGDVSTLFGVHSNAGDQNNTVVVDNQFAFKYWSDGTTKVPAFDYYSDNSGNNSGYPANTNFSHVLAYMVNDPSSTYNGTWFVGFEDTNYSGKGGASYHRFDFNDNVIMMTYEAVPEPAFYQMAGMLSLGAFGLLRMRRRSA
jgi:hypothetical protein